MIPGRFIQLGILLAAVQTASAHHAAGLVYDTDNEQSMEAIVTRFELGNPHVRIYFKRPEDGGNGEEWMAEGGSRTVLLRRGWTEDMLKAGDRITLHGHPSRDDRPIFHVVNMEHDGKEIGTEDSTSENLLDQLRQRRR